MMPGGVYSRSAKFLCSEFIAGLAKMLKLNGLVGSVETLTPQTPHSHEMRFATSLFRQFRESGRAAVASGYFFAGCSRVGQRDSLQFASECC